jgi:hypothetical protein
MIILSAEHPEGLWFKMGELFFSKDGLNYLDYRVADRRFFSFNNTLVVKDWPKGWDNPYLFHIVGYSASGSKMKTLAQTYLNQETWGEFKAAIEEWGVADRRNGIKTFGVNFNLRPKGKGGCLCSFHLIQSGKEISITVHMKVAEFPRKFVGDLRFISYLITSLDLPHEKYKVTFQLSTLYYSIIGLRSYIPVLGTVNMDMHDLPIDEPRHYQEGVIEAIYKSRKALVKEWGKNILLAGIPPDFLKDRRTTCVKDQIEQLIS